MILSLFAKTFDMSDLNDKKTTTHSRISLLLLKDPIAAWAASSPTPPSAQRTCRCPTVRRGTQATAPTAGPWRSWAPVRRSTWTSCCRTRRKSPSTSPPSPTASPTRSAPSAGWRHRSRWGNCARTSTAMRSVRLSKQKWVSYCYWVLLLNSVAQHIKALWVSVTLKLCSKTRLLWFNVDLSKMQAPCSNSTVGTLEKYQIEITFHV